MDVVVKISNDYTQATTIAQLLNPDGLKFIDELVNTGSLEFSIPLSESQIFAFTEFKKIAIYSVESASDLLLWTGYISDIENDFAYANIKCGDEKDFLRSKMLFSFKDYSATTLQNAISEMVSEANGRKGTNEAALDFDVNTVASMLMKKTFQQGTSYFDIIKEVCESLNIQWTVRFNKIILATSIGIDRSLSNENFFPLIWNAGSPNENNITKFKNKRSASEIATHVYGKSSSGNALISGDKSIYGSIERSVSMDDGNITTQTQEYINKHQTSQLERELDVEISEQMARIIQIGDTVPVKIIHGSALVDTEANLKVIQKSAAFENKKPTIKVKVSTDTKQILNMENFLADLHRRVKRFELN